MNEVEEIKRVIHSKKPDLTINRLPESTKEAFIELANEEFCGDYGMCLKFLLEMYAPRTAMLEERIRELENRAESNKIKNLKGEVIADMS